MTIKLWSSWVQRDEVSYQCNCHIYLVIVQHFNVRVTTDKRLLFNSKVYFQMNYKGITTVYIQWRISDA